MEDEEYVCPSCGGVLMEDFGTDMATGKDERTFVCFAMDCMQIYDEDEIDPVVTP